MEAKPQFHGSDTAAVAHFIMYRWTRSSALEPMSTHLDYPKT